MKVLVTGGAGFIGSHLVDKLISQGFDVVVLDNLSTGYMENINSKCKFHNVDITKFEEIESLFTSIKYVFHLAALPRVQVSIDDPVYTNNINVNGTINVLMASKNAKVERLVYSASSSAYGNQEEMPLKEDMVVYPLSPYGLQKYIGEQYCRLFSELYNLPTVSLRYFNVYGERQASEGPYVLVTSIFTRQRDLGEPLTITGDGEQRRDFTSVIDVVQANIKAIESSKVGQGEVINIGRGNNYSINDLAHVVGGPVKYIQARIEPRETLADISLAKKLIDWRPSINLHEWFTK